MVMNAHWFGDRAVRVNDADYRHASALQSSLPGLSVRVGIDSLLVVSPTPDGDLLDHVMQALQSVTADIGPPGSREVIIDVVYDGVDLPDVSMALACSPDDLIRAHCEQAWRVAMVGFAPGFGYLVPAGPWLLDWAGIPRLDSPRSRVPAGSVAIAAGMSAVYPTAMPGGWNLIGTSTAPMFDVSRVGSESLLEPGVRVVFEVSS